MCWRAKSPTGCSHKALSPLADSPSQAGFWDSTYCNFLCRITFPHCFSLTFSGKSSVFRRRRKKNLRGRAGERTGENGGKWREEERKRVGLNIWEALPTPKPMKNESGGKKRGRDWAEEGGGGGDYGHTQSLIRNQGLGFLWLAVMAPVV